MDQAIDWLDRNAEKTIEEITAKSNEEKPMDDSEAGPALEPGEEAQSLVCNECGRQLRSHAQAEFHASKTGHINFSESTEVIKPLTEEEKEAKLEELRRKAAEKRAGAAEVDKAEQKRNEVHQCYRHAPCDSLTPRRKSAVRQRKRRRTSRRIFRRRSKSRMRKRSARRSKTTLRPNSESRPKLRPIRKNVV